jgi:hypothetical protein
LLHPHQTSKGDGDGHGDRGKESSRAKKWKICFEKFLMSLADQQLVMSLAIPVAVFAKWSKTSLFSLDKRPVCQRNTQTT